MKFLLVAYLLVSSMAFANNYECYVSKSMGGSTRSTIIESLPLPMGGEVKYFTSNTSEVVVVEVSRIEGNMRMLGVYFAPNLEMLKDESGINPYKAIGYTDSVIGYYTDGQDTLWLESKSYNGNKIINIGVICSLTPDL